ncbi:hypothetical protein FJ250_13900, partial [bacterium]|nr:hypothetical protein [bacterium]
FSGLAAGLAVVAAAVVVAVVAAAVVAAAPVAAAAAPDRVAVIAGDFNSVAYVTGLGLEAPWSAAPVPGEPVHHDAVLRWRDGLAWVVNRGGADNIQVLDPAAGFDTVRQFSLGLGRNLQDIAFRADGTAYVSCYDTAELLHIDPQAGQILQVISTAAFADADGLPETGWLLARGGRLFVTCQRLNRDNWYAPVGDSYLLALDMDANTWLDCDAGRPGVQGLRLAAANPYAPVQVSGDRLLVGCTGYYGLRDGGVDVVDPDALVSLGLEITETALGGDLVDLEATEASRHVIVADSAWVTRVRRYAPGVAPVTVLVGQAYDHADIAWDGGFQLYVADRRLAQPGVRVFDVVSGAQLTTAPIATGLPPALVIPPPAGAAAPVGLIPSALALDLPWPNPANPLTRFAFTAPPSRAVELRLLDLRGRLVREVRLVTGPDGRGAWEFDGRDAAGRAVPSGIYRCVVQTGEGFAARSFTVIR